MAHEHVFGFCENKCAVEVAPIGFDDLIRNTTLYKYDVDLTNDALYKERILLKSDGSVFATRNTAFTLNGSLDVITITTACASLPHLNFTETWQEQANGNYVRV